MTPNQQCQRPEGSPTLYIQYFCNLHKLPNDTEMMTMYETKEDGQHIIMTNIIQVQYTVTL